MPDIQTQTESNIFTLYVKRLNTVYDNFERRLSDYVDARRALGISQREIYRQLLDDLDNGQAIFGDLVGQAARETDFGLNASYQVASNERIATKVKWTLNPQAEHCDSCLHQASLPPRTYDQVPFPGFQPTHGETNCTQYCKCTLEPA